MTDHSHEQNPPCGQPPPALFHTSTTRNQTLLPDFFTNLTSIPSNPTVTPHSRPPPSKLFPSSAKPWHCAECPAVSTPLRRRGPQGRKTLCNACGIRYGKRMKEAKQANQSNRTTNPQTLHDRNRAQRDMFQWPFQNETAVRKRDEGASKSSKRRKLERQPEGQCSNSHLSCTVAPVVSQHETGGNPDFLDNGIGMSFAVKAAVPQDEKTVTLTEDATTRAEHSTISRMNAEDVVMRTEPPITSPPMPWLFSYTLEALPNHPNMVDQAACVSTAAFFAPGGTVGMNFEIEDHETENAITREDFESKTLTGMPSPRNMYQLTRTRPEGESIQTRLQCVDDGATCLHTDQNTNSNRGSRHNTRDGLLNFGMLTTEHESSNGAHEFGCGIGWMV